MTREKKHKKEMSKLFALSTRDTESNNSLSNNVLYPISEYFIQVAAIQNLGRELNAEELKKATKNIEHDILEIKDFWDRVFKDFKIIQQVLIVWWAEDVKQQCPLLTDWEASEVLKNLDKNHNAEIGINWDVIDETIRMLYPEKWNKYQYNQEREE